MNYKVEKIAIDMVSSLISEFQYALIYYFSEVCLCNVVEMKEFDINQCQEARFFGEKKELHLYRVDDQMKAVLVSDGEAPVYVDKKYAVSNQFKKAGNAIIAREYIDYDQDGQLNVKLTRLKGIE